MGDTVVVTYLASPRLAKWRQWTRLDCLAASLKLLRLHAATWPVIVFHEDYNEDDKKRLSDIAGYVTFEKVDFSGNEKFYANRRPDSRVGSYGYCMMCRFFGGQVQAHPALQQYSHYMRLDDDSYLLDHWTSDCIERMLAADYAYRSVYQEDWKELWDFALSFAGKHGIARTQACEYDRSMPYNNFHISKLSMWQHPIVKKFLAELEADHWHVARGTTDTSVHAAILYVLGSALGFKAHAERGFGYRHNQHCVHDGPHGKYCSDGTGGALSWGPPEL